MDPSDLNSTIALFLSISGSFCTALSLILIKVASIRIEKFSNQKWYRVYFHPIGSLGLVLLILGLVLNTLAVDYASIMLLASTPCFTIVFNSVLSPCILGEKFSLISELLACFLLLIGSLLCILYANNP